jgi:hypothetical protein
MFDKRVLRIIFGLERREWQETGEDCIMRSVITFVLYKLLLQ